MTTSTNLANSQPTVFWPEGHAKSLHTVYNWRVVPAEKLTPEEKRALYNKAVYAAKKARKATQ